MRRGRGLDELDRRSVARSTPLGSTAASWLRRRAAGSSLFGRVRATAAPRLCSGIRARRPNEADPPASSSREQGQARKGICRRPRQPRRIAMRRCTCPGQTCASRFAVEWRAAETFSDRRSDSSTSTNLKATLGGSCPRVAPRTQGRSVSVTPSGLCCSNWERNCRSVFPEGTCSQFAHPSIWLPTKSASAGDGAR
jgi:hypothetical protein